MKKTSLYLTEAEIESLRRLSAATGRPQAEIVRDAITEYVTRHASKRTFFLSGAGKPGNKKRRGAADQDLDRSLTDILNSRRRREET